MEVDMHGHKRAEEEPKVPAGGDPKRPREGGISDTATAGAGGYQYMEEDDDELPEPPPDPLGSYRKTWVKTYGKTGSFEDETAIPPMRNTDGPVLPSFSWPMDMLQIFSVKVMEIMGDLQWPLDVYGIIAVRDSMDHKRNILFRRDRDHCQTLSSPQDSSLTLTGPSRAVILLDPVIFEVDLKIKSKGNSSCQSEDKVLSYHAFSYNNIAQMHYTGFARREIETTQHSTMEYTIAHLTLAVEATITVHVVEGSTDFKARFAARTADINEDVVLLDTGDKKAEVDDGGLVALQRRVVVVDEKGMLILRVEATDHGGGGGGASVVKELSIKPRYALRTETLFVLGFCNWNVMIAWSVLP